MQTNRNSFNNRANVPAWSTSQNGQPVQRMQNMLRQAQQAHINQQQAQNMQQSQPTQNQNQPQQPHFAQSHNISQNQPQQKKQYSDPSVTFEPVSEDLLKLMGQQNEVAKKELPIKTALDKPIDVNRDKGEHIIDKSSSHKIPQDLFKNPYLPQSLNVDALSGLMQDEQNGAVFYLYLSKRATNKKTYEALIKVAGDNEKRITALNEIYKDMSLGKPYEPKKNNIELNDSLKNCLRAAIAEENLIIDKIIDLMGTEKNPKFEMMLYRKLNNVNLILSLI